MSSRSERAEATRANLLSVARELFGSRGYGAVGTEEIVRAAGVTRGALYHQFTDKRDLFRAVFETVEQEIVEHVAQVALVGGADPVEGLRAGVRAWLDACMQPEVGRIVVLDAPAVLGWEEWRAIGERYGLGLITAALEGAMAAGALAEQPVGALAHVMVGALDEAALYVTRADDPARARAEMEAVIDRMLEGARA